MPAKIVTISGYKGGCGKSTGAIHVAAFLAERGNVVLVDGDPNRTSLNWHKRGDGRLGFDCVDERRAMKAITGRDFVVFDTPARPDSSDLKEMAQGCDLLILPMIPDIVNLEPTLQIAKDLGRAPYRTLISIVPPAPSREGETMLEDLRGNGVPAFSTLIRRREGYRKAALAGCVIRDVDDYRARQAWEDYENLGLEILELIR